MCFVLHLIHLFSSFTYQHEDKTGEALEKQKCTLHPNKVRNRDKIRVKNKRWGKQVGERCEKRKEIKEILIPYGETVNS